MQQEVFSEQRFSRSPVTSALIEKLRSIAEGGAVSYSDLSEVSHVEVAPSKKGYHYLKSAREIVEREFGLVFVCVPNVGLQRLANSQIAQYANTTHRQRLVSDTKRYRLKVEAVDESKLNQVQRTDLYAARAHVALREAVASKPVEKQIQASVSSDPSKYVDESALIARLKRLWK